MRSPYIGDVRVLQSKTPQEPIKAHQISLQTSPFPRSKPLKLFEFTLSNVQKKKFSQTDQVLKINRYLLFVFNKMLQ